MNGPQTPAFYKDNIFTRLTERVAEQNAADGRPAGRMLEQMGRMSPLIPASKLARMSKQDQARLDFVPIPEDPTHAMHANARAAAMGISNDVIPTMGDDLPGDIGHVSGDASDEQIDAMLEAAGVRKPGPRTAAERAEQRQQPTQMHVDQVRQQPSLAGFGAMPQPGLVPYGQNKMPNFASIQGFDLVRKVAIVDGLEFKLAETDVVDMKKFAIQVVLDNVTFQLAEALVQLGIPADMAQATAAQMRATATEAVTPGGMHGASEEVQPVRSNEAAGSVLPGSTVEGRTNTTMPVVREGVQRVVEQAAGEREVQDDSQGSGLQFAPEVVRHWPADDTGDLLGDGGITPE